MRASRPGFALLSTAVLLVGTGTPANSAAGEVVLYSNEFTKVTTVVDPVNCTLLPIGAHLMLNLTDQPMALYLDPLCLLSTVPASSVAPGGGGHVLFIGSFRPRR